MNVKTKKKSQNFIVGLFLTIGFLMFGNAQAAVNDGKKVSKQFVDEMSKLDPSYKSKIVLDKNGSYVDYNDPALTKALLDKATANKEVVKSSSNGAKLEVAPTSKTKVKGAEGANPNKLTTNKEINTNSASKVVTPKKVEVSKPQLEKKSATDLEYERKIALVNKEMKNASGEDLKRMKKSISELERQKSGTAKSKK